MKHRILWCTWQPGVDDADQDWTECVHNPGVDYTSRASCEREAELLALETEGRYSYRVVAVEEFAPVDFSDLPIPPQKTTIQRWIESEQRWIDIEVEITPAA